MTAPIPGQDKAPVKTPHASTSGNVRVVSRVRPMAPYEVDNGSKSVVTKVPHIMEDNDGPETLQISNGPGNDPRWFELDAVLDQTCSQQEVYEKSGAYQAISEDLFSGYNCTILAYGQTGAGKVRASRSNHFGGWLALAVHKINLYVSFLRHDLFLNPILLR